MFDIITFGSATIDIVVKPRKLTSLKYEKLIADSKVFCFPLGSKIDIDEIGFYVGGGGTNTAATFSKQGFKTAFCGSVGSDILANEVINKLKKLKIDISLILKVKSKPTNHSIVILSDNSKDRTILVYRGASELVNSNKIPWAKLKTKWIYLAPLSGLLSESFGQIIKFAKKNKIKVAINPSMAQLCSKDFYENISKADILLLNKEEAGFLTKIPLENETNIFKKLRSIFKGVIVVTKGEEGVIVLDEDYIYSAKPNPDRKIVDTTGAGDSFSSGFISGFIRNDSDIEKSIQLGMANSEGCISEFGAKNGLLKKDQKFNKVEVLKNKIS